MRFSGLAPCLLVVALSAVAAAPAPAAAQGRAQEEDVDPEARQRFQLATTLYGQGRFVEAAEEFERVYEITDNAVLLHNIYVAYRDAGDEPKAAQFLRQYLEEAEEIPDRAVMEGRLRTLERQVAEAEARDDGEVVEPPTDETTGPPAPVEPGDSQPQRPPPREQDSSWPIVVSAVVAAVGAAAVGVGAVLGVQAADQYEELENDCGPALICPATRQEDVDSLGATALAADILLIGGGVLAVGGLTWLIIEVAGGGDGGSASSIEPSLACNGHGCGASLRGAF